MTDSLSYLEPSERTERGRLSLTAIALIIGAMVVVIVGDQSGTCRSNPTVIGACPQFHPDHV